MRCCLWLLSSEPFWPVVFCGLVLSGFALRWLLAVLQYPDAAFDLCPLRACRLLAFAGVWPPAFRLCLEAPASFSSLSGLLHLACGFAQAQAQAQAQVPLCLDLFGILLANKTQLSSRLEPKLELRCSRTNSAIEAIERERLT